MRTSAIAVANYFIDLAKKENVNIYQFGLIKRVYVTHGFCLAVFDRSALDPNYDVVEAWKNGPVIPSVYHSFKHNRNNPIIEKSVIAEIGNKTFDFITPELNDTDVQEVAGAVWKRYLNMNDFELIKLLHRKGTPWGLCYQEGKNEIIPDLYTKTYYKKLLNHERIRQGY
ncbi:MAG: DUF4065 domain-containing protein [Bacteroidales bacterium]|jgi:uncharacterized phage-associated protein|nr:DUF4065 domain-containing protein [Bacteroidales bacterium]